MSALIAQSGMISHAVAGYDPDAQAIIDRMIPEPSTALKERLNAFVVGLKNPALWSVAGAMWYRLDFLFVPSTAQNEQSGLLDWKRPVSAILSGGAAWNSSLGFAGPAAGVSSVDTGWSPLADPDDNYKSGNAQLTVLLTRPNTRSNALIAGVENSIRVQISATVTATIAGRINTNQTATTISDVTPQAGQIITIQRDSPVTPFGSLMIDGVEFDSTQGPTALNYGGRNLRLLSSATSSVTSPSDGAVGFACAGSPMTVAEQLMLKSLYNAYVAAA